MKRLIVLFFVLLFGVSFVFAANGWGDINTGDDLGDDDAVKDSVSEVSEVAPIVYDNDVASVGEGEYTRDFYIALGLAGVGILLVIFFIYLFMRSPKNRWKKKVDSKVVKG